MRIRIKVSGPGRAIQYTTDRDIQTEHASIHSSTQTHGDGDGDGDVMAMGMNIDTSRLSSLLDEGDNLKHCTHCTHRFCARITGTRDCKA